MSVTVLIGQRACGKTSLLKKLSEHHPSWECIDLDEEIEKSHSKSIRSLFESGEEEFRKAEIKTFEGVLENINKSGSTLISLGAGFSAERLLRLKKESPDIKVVWVRRTSDDLDRNTEDRPPLKHSPSKLWQLRRENYQRCCDEVLFLPEGPFYPENYLSFVSEFLLGNFKDESSKLFQTLPSGAKDGAENDLPTELNELLRKLESIHSRGLRTELRNDLLDEATLIKIMKNLSPEEERRTLLSLRQAPGQEFKNVLGQFQGLLDCDLVWREFFEHSPKSQHVLSLHTEGHFDEQLKVFRESQQYAPEEIKWAPSLENLDDLETALDLANASEKMVSLLPRGPLEKAGIWKWVRILLRKRNTINFCQSFLEDQADQPTLWDHFLAEKVQNSTDTDAPFFAVIGKDTRLSWSPLFHSVWALNNAAHFLSLSLDTPPTQKNLAFLRKLGLKGAAVTSPFKEWACFLARTLEEATGSFANTLLFASTAPSPQVANTDARALSELCSQLPPNKSTLILGRGAIGQQLAALFPHADWMGARELEEGPTLSKDYELLIWATGPDFTSTKLPQTTHLVWDMNYFQHSQAHVYAQKLDAEYISGRDFFVKQAELQQEFWSQGDLNRVDRKS
jgi:shikimate kinase/shikimate 5-dehydrogenase/uncharacterized damage-inducible protein DinB